MSGGLINSENIAWGLLELKSIIKEMRGRSSVPQEQEEKEEKEQRKEMKAKLESSPGDGRFQTG